MENPNLLGWLLLTALACAFAYHLGRRKSADNLGGSAGSPAGTKVPLIYILVRRLSGFYQATAHPKDLLGNNDFEQGVALLREPDYSVDQVLSYLTSDNEIIACMAAEALRERGDLKQVSDRVLSSLPTVFPWPLYFLLQGMADEVPEEQSLVGRVLIHRRSAGENPYERKILGEFIQDRVKAGEHPEFGKELDGLSPQEADRLEFLLKHLDMAPCRDLLKHLGEWREAKIDRAFLASIGTLWDKSYLEKAGRVLEHKPLLETVAALEASYLGENPRSVLLVGESGVGKTFIARLLARRLQQKGWVVFEASHAELVAGQIFMGQFEQRLQALIGQLRGKRRILWIIPRFHTLALAGRHQYGPLSALDMILPHLEQGDIKLLGETHPTALDRLTQSAPRCTTVLETLRVEPTSDEETVELAKVWARERLQPDAEKSRLELTVLEAHQLAKQFLGYKASPGNLLELLEITRQRLSAGETERKIRMGTDDLITTLAQLTGLPLSLLDERRGLDLEALRRHFHGRVMGQPEAVDCLVERVAMIKAGVTDPTRPLGVFFFAGPTGTGKTEIGKALAEFLFRSQERLIRLDMSEFQTSESLDRIIGASFAESTVALVDQVRAQPFCVVLLDEFEKAHERIWDLFLQVFDDGRLTDRHGNTADFRHAIIILTSNLGGVIPSGLSLGFAKDSGSFRPQIVEREIGKAFRQEFLNRLDRVIVFRPLGRKVMREILEKEMMDVLERAPLAIVGRGVGREGH